MVSHQRAGCDRARKRGQRDGHPSWPLEAGRRGLVVVVVAALVVDGRRGEPGRHEGRRRRGRTRRTLGRGIRDGVGCVANDWRRAGPEEGSRRSAPRRGREAGSWRGREGGSETHGSCSCSTRRRPKRGARARAAWPACTRTGWPRTPGRRRRRRRARADGRRATRTQAAAWGVVLGRPCAWARRGRQEGKGGGRGRAGEEGAERVVVEGEKEAGRGQRAAGLRENRLKRRRMGLRTSRPAGNKGCEGGTVWTSFGRPAEGRRGLRG